MIKRASFKSQESIISVYSSQEVSRNPEYSEPSEEEDDG